MNCCIFTFGVNRNYLVAYVTKQGIDKGKDLLWLSIGLIREHYTRIPKKSTVMIDQFKTLVVSSKLSKTTKEIAQLDFNSIINELCKLLHKRNIQSIIIEGGSKTLQGFIDGNVWDEARIFTSPKILQDGIKSPVLNKNNKKSIKLKEDRLEIIYSQS